MARDPGATRERILSAAMTEFAAKGLAGARVAAIARRARANKRMLYHYWGDKAALFRAVVLRTVSEKSLLVDEAPDDLAASLPLWAESALRSVEWIRMLQWEALRGGAIAGERERRRFVRAAVAKLRRGRERGALAADLDPEQMILSAMALTLFPLAFPQLARLATGLAPTDRRFVARRRKFLRALGAKLRE